MPPRPRGFGAGHHNVSAGASLAGECVACPVATERVSAGDGFRTVTAVTETQASYADDAFPCGLLQGLAVF
jgi:hypothetical protein